jgi:hypothetical protein
MQSKQRNLVIAVLFVILMFAAAAVAQNKTTTTVTTPMEQFGHNVGDDYFLINYTQMVDYWKKLAQQSNRMKLVEVGHTAEGRTMYMAIITSPENQKKLEHYKDISRRLAMAEGLTDEQARALAAEGKSVVWIDGGLHATEVLGAQQLIETVYQLVSMNDVETQRILNNDIVLCTLVNPDGMELVSNWYMRNPDPMKRSMAALPVLYHKYVGHDDNRDFYMVTQPETEAINRVFYQDWFPQIIYNHHQTGPAGTVMFSPPFRDPFNYYFDPIIPMEIDLVGAAMHTRFAAEGKPGVTMRSGSSYSTWWNGGLRTTAYFHNMIGLLTETIGNPTPMQIPFLPERQLPKGDLSFPIAPQTWHFLQSIDYSITANRAVLDLAAKMREDFLFNIYRMGKNSMERGNRDTWTIHPRLVEQIEDEIAKESGQAATAGGRRAGADAPVSNDAPGGGGNFRGAPMKFFDEMHKPELRDPRGYIIPADQPDFPTATKFINTLVKNGITILRATKEFQVGGKTYPAGSFVVKAAQPFRPHVLDMFEPQDHPDDFAYPGGPPIPPYDNAGWTVAYQMGVVFDRILDGFDGPFEKLQGFAKPLGGTVASATSAVGFVLSHQTNDSFIATNRLLATGEDLYWFLKPTTIGGRTYAPGAIFIPAKSSTLPKLEKLASDLGLNFEGVATKPAGDALKLRPLRIALWDRYGGSMPSGWTRWILEQFEFPFTVVYPPTLDAGDLAKKFDVIIFVDGAIPGAGGGRGGGGGGGGAGQGGGGAENIPAEYRDRQGNITAAKTIPQLKRFMEEGGTVITIGSSNNLAAQIGLPVASALTEKGADGSERPLPRDKFYVPGSILRVHVDNTNPLAFGLNEKTDVFFDSSPSFKLRTEAGLKGIKPVAWFDNDHPLRSGWAWGQKYLQDSAAVIDANVGSGKLFMFGPEILFRAQPHGTFKFLFNGIFYGRSEVVKME